MKQMNLQTHEFRDHKTLAFSQRADFDEAVIGAKVGKEIEAIEPRNAELLVNDSLCLNIVTFARN